MEAEELGPSPSPSPKLYDVIKDAYMQMEVVPSCPVLSCSYRVLSFVIIVSSVVLYFTGRDERFLPEACCMGCFDESGFCLCVLFLSVCLVITLSSLVYFLYFMSCFCLVMPLHCRCCRASSHL